MNPLVILAYKEYSDTAVPAEILSVLGARKALAYDPYVPAQDVEAAGVALDVLQVEPQRSRINQIGG